MEPQSQDIIFKVENHVARITLNRPERLNALTVAMRHRWIEIITEMNANPDIFVGILSGAGDRAFCAGVDLKEMVERDASGKKRASTRHFPVLPQKPMVAAVHGHCLAGGFELTLLCDIRIATPNARFGLPEVRRSLLPIFSLNLLSGLIPRGEASYLLLTGEPIDADKALQIGLIHKILPDKAALEAEAERIAAAIAQGAPLAVQAAKKLLTQNSGVASEQGFENGFALTQQILASEDSKEGPRAFAEKRAPNWKGR